jgi:hypothetical protein
MSGDIIDCDALLAHLRQGDFSLLAPAFVPASPSAPRVLQLFNEGCFEGRAVELAEALTCAAFLGAVDVMEALLQRGVSPQGGDATGLNALHWAANRGQLEAVRRLLAAGAALETRNGYGGTVLGATVWASVHEPRDSHVAIIELLLHAGADVAAAEFPSGRTDVDESLRRFGAR